VVVVIVGVGGKDAIFGTTINGCHTQQRRHWHCWLNPTTVAINDDRYCRRQQLPSPLLHSQHSTVAAVFIDSNSNTKSGCG
jgi:hypothetical protein